MSVSKKVIEHDLRKISGKSEGDMNYGGFDESMSGNAGFYEKGGRRISCEARNFYYNSETGDIRYFGNYQSVPKQIRQEYSEGTMRRALDFKEGKQGIVTIRIHPKTSPEAAEALVKAAEKYNSEKGWKGEITLEGGANNSVKSHKEESLLERILKKFSFKKTALATGISLIILGFLFSFYPSITGFSILGMQVTGYYLISKILILLGLIILFSIFLKKK